MLVALDNAEQVVDGVARVVQAVLDQAPALRFIVTSQAPLKLAAERTYRIGALAVPQGPLPAAQALEFGAVALFTERAQAADARFSPSETNAPAVIDLVGNSMACPSPSSWPHHGPPCSAFSTWSPRWATASGY
jgi:predicted ATPase